MHRRVFDRGEVQRWLSWALEQETDECLLWPFGFQSRGYPKFWDGEKDWLAHRVVCERAHGPAPDHYDAAHSCGTRACCNKRHLSWKTHADNLEDRRAHGTLPMGESDSKSVLTEQQVQQIRRTARTRGVGTELARQMGVHPNTVYSARDGRSWKHLT